jgi:glutaredoxin
MSRSVTVYVADGCHLCEAALEVIAAARREIPFDLAVVNITGDGELEARYRQLIPVVEVDGRRTFTYYVTADGLREALG